MATLVEPAADSRDPRDNSRPRLLVHHQHSMTLGLEEEEEVDMGSKPEIEVHIDNDSDEVGDSHNRIHVTVVVVLHRPIPHHDGEAGTDSRPAIEAPLMNDVHRREQDVHMDLAHQDISDDDMTHQDMAMRCDLLVALGYESAFQRCVWCRECPFFFFFWFFLWGPRLVSQ